MKSFLLGALGAILVLIVFVFAAAQYSDYRSQSEVWEWLNDIKPSQMMIENKAKLIGSVDGAGVGVSLPEFVARLGYSDINDNGVIFLKGGNSGQFIVLIPSISEGVVTWKCIGGSDVDVPSQCSTLN